MIFTLDIRPLSINEAWVGRRWKTPVAKQYDRTMHLLLPNCKVVAPYYKVYIDWHFKNFGGRDLDNPVKPLLDCLVRKGIITDDRRIVELRVRKFKAEKDGMNICIE